MGARIRAGACVRSGCDGYPPPIKAFISAEGDLRARKMTRDLRKAVISSILIMDVSFIVMLWIWSAILWRWIHSGEGVLMIFWGSTFLVSLIVLIFVWWEYENPMMKRFALISGVVGLFSVLLVPIYWIYPGI